MAKLEQRKGLYGGFKPGSTGGPGTGKFKNTVKRIANNVKRKAGDIASNIKNNKKTEEPTLAINTGFTSDSSIGYENTNPSDADRYIESTQVYQPIADPNAYAATLAGGSRPMTAMNNPQVDPMTGMPITQGGQANMNPNFIGDMANSNLPTTGMLAQEKADKSDSTAIFMGGRAPGQFAHYSWKAAADSAKKRFPNIDADKINDHRKIQSRKFYSTITPEHLDVVNNRYGIRQDKVENKMKDYRLTGITVDADVNTKNSSNFNPTTVKPDKRNPGIVKEQSPENVVLNWDEDSSAKDDYRRRSVRDVEKTSKDARFRKQLKNKSAALGVPDPVDSVLDFVSDSGPIFNQDKAIPKGTAGKGLRSLPISVRENMGYDPLSQERLTQSRRSTKCMRVKKR
tara:strand:+ start:2099 stop:3295 length:1197 start_codon:yes stop_codon:yes gene_type:complete